MAEQSQLTAQTEAHESGLPHFLSRLRSYFIFDPLIWLYTIVLGSLSLISSLLDKDGEIQHGFARFWSRMILATIGIPVQVIGLEKIDTSRSHVYVVNHLSALDIPVLYVHLPFQFRILAKKELFRYPFMGWHLKRSGQIPVVLDNAKASIRSLTLAVKAVQNNMPLVVFPEGGRSETGQLQPFMGGAFFAAIRAQTDVIPMALVGTYEILKMNTWHIRPRPVQLWVGDPISTEGMTTRDTETLSARARQAIAMLYYAHGEIPDLRENQPTQESRK
ncbi:MAG TPA: lysophospholipid acyltransferase family protein [Candidatus Limnocylindrales bacterium]|jgi:1-acyl-sn-glycerol-3-phosphate acyltransferase|nr:lysophospholipid acyltransferase family protein [Candidatus Limnocylindrales bacterium]